MLVDGLKESIIKRNSLSLSLCMGFYLLDETNVASSVCVRSAERGHNTEPLSHTHNFVYKAALGRRGEKKKKKKKKRCTGVLHSSL